MPAAVYVETSALLRAVLEGDAGVQEALRATAGSALTSALTFVEAERALLRAVGAGRLGAREHLEVRRWLRAFASTCDVIQLEPSVLARAGQAFPAEPVRTLDALHLASALVWEQQVGEVVFLSCDERVRGNAAALGFQVLPASA